MASIQKRGNGYRIRVFEAEKDGKKVMRSMTWTPAPGMSPRKIEAELARKAIKFEDTVKAGKYVDGSITVKDFVKRWFEDYGKSNLKERTYHEYMDMTKRIYPAIGHIKIGKLQPNHLIEFYNQLSAPDMNRRGGTLSPKTIKNYHAMLSSVLERAVKWGVIPENPCRRVDPPKYRKKDIEFLDDKQAVFLLNCLDNEPILDRTLITLAIYTGFRAGELLGLEWPDIDFGTGVITVKRTSQYCPERGVYTSSPKTEQSKRSIKVADAVLNLLRLYKVSQAEQRLSLGDLWSKEWADHPRLFVGMKGQPMHPNQPLKILKRIEAKYNLPKVCFHSLRHTNATLLIQQGVNVRTVSSRLGHSQTSTTMNIYAHQIQSADAAAADALDVVLGKKQA